ncbi:MAG: hypothetical protein WAN69_17610 [Candidatus Korobacteraceae bacterium]
MDSEKRKSWIYRASLVVFAVALMTAVGFAQAPPPPLRDGMFMGGPGPASGMMGGEFGDGKTVTGAPLTAVVTVTRDTTLADGNKIHNESQAKVYRDSQGRVRRDVGVDLVTPATGNVKRNVVMIMDPVAGKRYMLNPDNKTARAMPMHGPRQHGDKGTDAANGETRGPAQAGALKKEDLGTKTVNGLQAEGVRVTRTIAAGSIGNDKPIDVVTERWYSPDLQIAIMTIHSDPMMGTVTTKLTNVTRGDPDSSLFQVPSDYTVETGKPNEPMYMPMKP